MAEGTADVPLSRQREQYVRIMGARVGALTETEAVQTLVASAVAGQGLWMLTANLDHLRRCHQEPSSGQLLGEVDLIVADGTPLLWASRLAGAPLPGRVAGSDLIWSLCKEAASAKVPMFLLGGNPGVADRAAAVLLDRYPGLSIAGTLCPPFGFNRDEDELRRIELGVAEARPGIVLVGLGFPKQDLLIRRLRRSLPGASFVGVGASFSFVCGEIPRAPRWTQNIGLEWAHRLSREPRRLARRYLLQGLPFAVRLLASAAGHRLRGGIDPAWGWESPPPDRHQLDPR